MDMAQVVAILGMVAPLTIIIPFLVRLFVKPLITSELDKQSARFEKLFNDHLRIDHGYRGGGSSRGRTGKPNFSYIVPEAFPVKENETTHE